MIIEHLHIEASSYCNARCPGCPRNGYGYPLEGFFKEKNLRLEQLHQLLDTYKDVTKILYCGNHGDPMMHPDIAEMSAMDNIKVEIATNGSIGKLDTYKQLATQKGTRIIFGIDGLEDTNHLYRQGVNWHKLISRVKTFTEAGGDAEWQFIRFQHNMHQEKQARELSHSLGFNNFVVRDEARNNMPAIQTDKSISHWILPPDKDAKPREFDVAEYLKMRYEPYDLPEETYKITKMQCDTLVNKSLYVDSSGEVYPCCYHGFGHVDRPKVHIEGFEELRKTWKTNKCNKVCAETCGTMAQD